ncbi:NADH-quinone oxidoreductase subunit C [Streptomyces sp. SAS_270]|uniref:NADH-quinone oxidoreductase subunit C n=1 Tax=Streptomyces sp. SAS_270 TaxID=3412748 RepID=UPI00403D1784
MTVGWLPAPVEELFGPEATAEESYDVLTVDVPPTAWITALETARTTLSCTYFDWLSAVDEPGTGFRVSAHVVALSPVRRLLVRTTVPHEAAVLPSAISVYAGAAWHERETHEMFGVSFEGHPALDHLLLPENFEGHPLRKDFVLAARVAKAWPGAKEPGESEHGGPKRRQMLPPGVPDPNEWGPLKGQLPPAPSRPARGAARAAGDRPARRARTAAEGSVGQAAAEGSVGQAADEGSVGQTAPPASADTPAPARRARSASQGSATQRAQTAAAATPSAAPAGNEPKPPAAPSPSGPDTSRGTDAPWHHARPAFEEPGQDGDPKATPATDTTSGTEAAPTTDATSGSATPATEAAPESVPQSDESQDPASADPEDQASPPDPSDAANPADPAGGAQ